MLSRKLHRSVLLNMDILPELVNTYEDVSHRGRLVMRRGLKGLVSQLHSCKKTGYL